LLDGTVGAIGNGLIISNMEIHMLRNGATIQQSGMAFVISGSIFGVSNFLAGWVSFQLGSRQHYPYYISQIVGV
jgi:hypothetical protein